MIKLKGDVPNNGTQVVISIAVVTFVCVGTTQVWNIVSPPAQEIVAQMKTAAELQKNMKYLTTVLKAMKPVALALTGASPLLWHLLTYELLISRC